MKPRWLAHRVRALLQTMPAVFLGGARQVGKTTLAKHLVSEGVLHAYFTFDNLLTLESAQNDPVGFVRALPEGSVLDEVQRAPELLLPLKQRIDEERKSGMFLLTGSANPLTLPQVADALVGRVGMVNLYPLSQGEIDGVREGWLARAFDGRFEIRTVAPSEDIWTRVLRGGYPSAVQMPELAQSRAWLQAYADALITREVQQLSNIERIGDLARLLRLLCARACQILNTASLSREMGVPHSTLQRYLTLLETLMVFHRLRPWHANIGQQFLKSPKIVINDTGLIAALLMLDAARLQSEEWMRGRILENFVAMEILKQLSYTDSGHQFYHFRTAKGREIDLLIEDAQGRIVGVEVKAAHTVSAGDFQHLRWLAQALGTRWAGGVVLHLGAEQVPFGENLWAVPIACLWEP